MTTASSLKDYKKIVDASILELSDCDTMEEAVEYFERIRHKEILPRTQALFDELHAGQLAQLFKIKIDARDIIIKDNVMELKK